MRKFALVCCLAGALLVGGTSAAIADSGTFVRYAYGVVFYYGYSNGDSDSYSFNGGPVFRLCQDAPGSSFDVNFYSKLVRNRSLQPDDTVRQIASQYSNGRRCAVNYDTSSSSDYHVRVDWVYANAGQGANGYGRAE